MAAYLSVERRANGSRPARTVRELIAEFKGLTATTKQQSVAQISGLSWSLLTDLIVDDDVDVTVSDGFSTR